MSLSDRCTSAGTNYKYFAAQRFTFRPNCRGMASHFRALQSSLFKKFKWCRFPPFPDAVSCPGWLRCCRRSTRRPRSRCMPVNPEPRASYAELDLLPLPFSPSPSLTLVLSKKPREVGPAFLSRSSVSPSACPCPSNHYPHLYRHIYLC